MFTPSRQVSLLLAACLLAACSPVTGTPETPSQVSDTSASPSPTPSASTTPVENGNTWTVTLDGEKQEFFGELENPQTKAGPKLSYSQGRYRDPLNPEPGEVFRSASLTYSKNDGLKPFTSAKPEPGLERMFRMQLGGDIYDSTRVGTETVTDTLELQDGRIVGTWAFKTTAGATGDKRTVSLTVDLTVPPAFL
ncbi:MAG: hypothetical protein ACLGIN_09260 [Candidatus Sericytochromatia bacterium]